MVIEKTQLCKINNNYRIKIEQIFILLNYCHA